MKNTLAQRLEFLFTELSISQTDFAKKSGFGQSYISQILNGKKISPSTRFYATVSRLFNVNPLWLQTGKGKIFILPDGKTGTKDAEILAKYRLLPETEQRIINEMINALLINKKQISQKRKIRK